MWMSDKFEILKYVSVTFLSVLMFSTILEAHSEDAETFETYSKSLEWKKGKKLYADLCAHCHGDMGEGVDQEDAETLYGDRSIQSLTKLIEETMPEKHPEKCVDQDAEWVTKYIFYAFYSPEARARINPPRRELAHLTSEQYRQSVTDLVAFFRPKSQPGNKHGLSARYYNSRRFSSKELKKEITDTVIEFDWKDKSPEPEKIKSEEFSVLWRGSVTAPATGDYSFRVVTENGAKLWVNDMENVLIDSWVSSAMLKKDSGQIFLVGGRAYPIRLDFFKFKDKSASIKLEWAQPGDVFQTIPEKYLHVSQVPYSYVPSTPFPPDDQSLGFTRGTDVSRQWIRATTIGGLEVAGFIAEEMESFTRTKKNHKNFRNQQVSFLNKFAELAFVQYLTQDEKQFYIQNHVPENGTSEQLISGAKKSVLLILKSPKFLYPQVAEEGDFANARMISLALWDSIPDLELLRASSSGELDSEAGIRNQVRRMLFDQRTKMKLDAFFHHWLELEEANDIDKNVESFPGFNSHLISDLKKSMHLFLDDITWGDDPDYRRLLLDSNIYVNKRLVEFYNIPDVAFPNLRKPGSNYEFVTARFQSDYRAGVITHPLMMSSLAYYNSTSPIHRGVFLTRSIMGRFLKPPPNAIEFKDDSFNPHLTMREKVTKLTEQESCMVCHSIINPLGFSVENFDSAGRFQTHDKSKEIDTLSTFLDVDGDNITFKGPRDVGLYASQNRLAQLGFIDQLFHHLIKNPAAAYGPKTRNSLLDSFRKSDYNIRDLIEEITVQAVLRSQIINAF